MKPSTVYTLKVCLGTLLVAVPLTMAIGFAYIGLITLIQPANYSFTFNIPFNHVFIFVAIIAISITLSIYLTEKMGYKRFINDRPIAHSIVIFLFYLIASKSIFFMDFDHILFSYAPMFVIAYVFSKLSAASAKRDFWNLPNEKQDKDLKALSDQ